MSDGTRFVVKLLAAGLRVAEVTAPTRDDGLREHVWISNAAFARMTGIVKVCMDCRLGLEKGERLTKAERYCPGRDL